MRAHTITTKARVGARGRMKRTILALSLAVMLFAATASSAAAGSGPYLSEGGPSATSGAGAAKFKGRTDQGLDVTVRVGDDGLVNRVNIENRVGCRKGPDHITGHSTYRAPLDESTPTSFADKKRNTTHPGGARVRVKHEITGERISDTEWTGTVQRKIRANGRISLRCKTGEIGWSTTLVS
jgi:hypothetical protein